MAKGVKKDKGCEARPEELTYEGLGKRGGVELIGLTQWAASLRVSAVKEGTPSECLRLEDTGKKCCSSGQQVSYIPTRVDETHMDTDMHTRACTHPPIAEIPSWYT